MMALIVCFFNIRLLLHPFITSESPFFVHKCLLLMSLMYAFVMLNLSFTGEKWPSNVF